MGFFNLIFQQHDSESFFEVWVRFKDFLGLYTTYSLLNKFYLKFLFGLNEETERWVKDGVYSSGVPLLSRSEDEVFYLLEDMANYDYQ